MDSAKRLNKTLTTLINSVIKVEEAVLKQSTAGDLSITEIHTLEAIGEGKPKTMTHVAAGLKINVSTLTAAINKLVVKGYANRFRIPDDRRMVMLELTESGVKAVREHEEFHLTMIRDSLAQLAPDEIEKFIESLDDVNAFMMMRRVNPSPGKEISITPDRIYQGGMGIGVSMSRLAAAVAICGGTGIISATEPGYNEKDYLTNTFEANKRALVRNIREALEAVKDAGGKGAIGINILCTADNYEEYVNAALEAGVQVIVSGGGVPTALPGICKDADVKLIPVVSSARAASVIIRNWAKKYNRAPDAIIFEGPMAGGNLGFKEEQMGRAQENFYKTIVEIKDETANFAECRLIVGGGVFSRQDAEKVLACGADGVQMGSRFVTTVECDAQEAYKQAYLNCKESDIITVKGMGGRVDRVLNNRFAERIQTECIPIASCNGCILTCEREEARFCLKEALIKAVNGDIKNGLIFCGGKAWKADRIETVKDIFDEFICV